MGKTRDRHFFGKLKERQTLIAGQPRAFRLMREKKGMRASVLTKQTTIFYTIEGSPEHIRIQAVFDTRQNPDKLNL